MTASAIPAPIRELVHARTGGWCEAHIRDVCTGFVQHLHHRILRSRGGQHTVDNLLGVCTACHTFIHANPAAATALDLMATNSPKE